MEVGFHSKNNYRENALNGFYFGYFSHDYDPKTQLIGSLGECTGRLYAVYNAFVYKPCSIGIQLPGAILKHSLKFAVFFIVLIGSLFLLWTKTGRKLFVYSIGAVGGSLAALLITPIKTAYLLGKGVAGIIVPSWNREYNRFEEKVFRVSNKILDSQGNSISLEYVETARRKGEIGDLQAAAISSTMEKVHRCDGLQTI